MPLSRVRGVEINQYVIKTELKKHRGLNFTTTASTKHISVLVVFKVHCRKCLNVNDLYQNSSFRSSICIFTSKTSAYQCYFSIDKNIFINILN